MSQYVPNEVQTHLAIQRSDILTMINNLNTTALFCFEQNLILFQKKMSLLLNIIIYLSYTTL